MPPSRDKRKRPTPKPTGPGVLLPVRSRFRPPNRTAIWYCCYYAAPVVNEALTPLVTNHCAVLIDTMDAADPSAPVNTNRCMAVVAASVPNVTVAAVLALIVTPNVLPCGLTTNVIASPTLVGGVRIQFAAADVELVPSSINPLAVSAVDPAVLDV